jgi:hypothetical protein
MKGEDRLKAEGWTRQSNNDEPRLGELVKMYKDMGLEVHLEPLRPEEMAECDQCMRSEPERYKTIYTRPGRTRPSTELEDLY